MIEADELQKQAAQPAALLLDDCQAEAGGLD
jgi:hypothetical protein